MWHGDLAKVGQFIVLMDTPGCRSSAVAGTTATGHGRRDADQELEGCDEVGPAGVPAHHVDQHGSDLSAVQLEDGHEHDCKASGDHEVAASEDREVLGRKASAGERLFVPRTRWTSAWRSETATGPEIVRHADEQRRCWKNLETTALRVSYAPRQ